MMDEIGNAMPRVEPGDLAGPEYPSARPPDPREQKALEINSNEHLTFPQKVDEMAELRGWFRGENPRIDTFLSSRTITATDLAAEIAAPIDEAYFTANHGRAYYEAEGSARTQRKFHTPEKALELWGERMDFEKPSEEVKDTPSAEAQLWDLWYSILHAAKKLTWDDEEGHGRLIDLVKALKARPDPAPPNPMTVPLRRNWIWSSGKVWSNSNMLGPAARESWNDSCGCGAGWTPVETAAWTNINAFVARLVSSGVADMFYLYGEWALAALEQKWERQSSHRVGETEVVRETVVRIAAIWVIIAGRQIYERREMDSHGVDGNDIDINKRGRSFPWVKFKHGVTGARWTWWKRRFEQEASDTALDESVRDLATKAAQIVERFGEDL